MLEELNVNEEDCTSPMMLISSGIIGHWNDYGAER